ncbi:hypothetical protein GCM10017687_76150 [Streptomyces echinatus]
MSDDAALDLRASDADRDRVAEILRDALAEGRLDMEEFEERLESAYRARTYGELAPLTRDLPAAGAVAPAGAGLLHQGAGGERGLGLADRRGRGFLDKWGRGAVGVRAQGPLDGAQAVLLLHVHGRR